MICSKIILWIFAIGTILGGLDSLRENKHGLGERFLAGIRTFEPLFLTMAGILVLVPFLKTVLAPVITPVYAFFGTDPALFAGTFLANDMGAFSLAHSLTEDTRAADFSGMLLGSVLGVNLVFTLPAAMKLIDPDDRPHLFQGLLYGFITLPIGCFLGGLTAGYPVMFTLKLVLPILIAALLAVLFLRFAPDKLSAVLKSIGRIVECVALVGVVAAIVLSLTGFEFPNLIEAIQKEALPVIGSIVLVLPGAYVTLELFQRGSRRFLKAAGKILGVNETAVLGLVSTLANSIPTMAMLDKMDERGKTMNFAFMTAGAFVLGDHLAFCCAVAPELALPLLATKFTAGFAALLLARLLYKEKKK